MVQDYFQGCKTAQEIKTRYRELCRKYHPDLGGDTATMQAVLTSAGGALPTVTLTNYSKEHTTMLEREADKLLQALTQLVMQSENHSPYQVRLIRIYHRAFTRWHRRLNAGI